MNKMMSFILASISSNKETQVGKILDTFRQLMREMLLPFIIIVGTASMIYGIWLGVNYSRSDGETRANAQKRIINFIIGLVAVIILLVLLALYVHYGDGIVDWVEEMITNGRKTGGL